MSVAEKLLVLGECIEDIVDVIAAKGGTLSQNAGFNTFASDIASIPQKYATDVVTFSETTYNLTVNSLNFIPKYVAVRIMDRSQLTQTDEIMILEYFIDFTASTQQLLGIGTKLLDGSSTFQTIAANTSSTTGSYFVANQNGFEARFYFSSISKLAYYVKDKPYRWIAIG